MAFYEFQNPRSTSVMQFAYCMAARFKHAVSEYSAMHAKVAAYKDRR